MYGTMRVIPGSSACELWCCVGLGGGGERGNRRWVKGDGGSRQGCVILLSDPPGPTPSSP